MEEIPSLFHFEVRGSGIIPAIAVVIPRRGQSVLGGQIRHREPNFLVLERFSRKNFVEILEKPAGPLPGQAQGSRGGVQGRQVAQFVVCIGAVVAGGHDDLVSTHVNGRSGR